MQPIDFESLKESGGIEYNADVVWGLQLQCLNDTLFDSSAKTKEKREELLSIFAEASPNAQLNNKQPTPRALPIYRLPRLSGWI